MEEIRLKTTIKCAGCIAKVTPFLNETAGENNWEVNINDPSKILTVKGITDHSKIIESVQKAGFKAEAL